MIQTRSKFFYGFDVESQNQFLDISVEASIISTLTIAFGNYTITEGIAAVRSAFAGPRSDITVTIDRETLLVTISSSTVFDLNLTGPSSANSLYPTLGFTQGVDLTGQTSYTGASPCGDTYSPQFWLQSYVPPEHFIELSDASINRAADGRVEVVQFGEIRKIQMEVKFITSLKMDGTVIENNQTGVADALRFLSYISKKKKFEFAPDRNLSSEFYKVIIDQSPGYKNGTGFKLKEMLSDKIIDVFETGVFTLEVVR